MADQAPSVQYDNQEWPTWA